MPLGRFHDQFRIFVEISEASESRIQIHGLGTFLRKPKTLNLIIMGILLLKIPLVCEKHETDFVLICTLNRSPAALWFSNVEISEPG